MPENTSRSFVVHIWIESRDVPEQGLEWRGTVQDVISGERKYFMKFDDMITFIIGKFSHDISKTKGSKQ